jgi:hypothetical protein
MFLARYVIMNCAYRDKMLYYCMTPDDGRMTETCCGSNNRGGREELLR